MSDKSLSAWVLFGAPAALLAILSGVLGAVGALEPLVAWAEQPYRTVLTGLGIVIVALLYVSVVLYAYISRVKQKHNIIAKNLDSELKLANAEHNRIQQKMSSDHENLKRQLSGQISAVDSIVHRLYDIDHTRWKFTSVHETYTISAGGDAIIERKYTVEAGMYPAQIWRLDIFADNSADPVEYLSDLHLKIEVVDPPNGEDLRYLVYDNSSKRKRLAIFFLPEIAPAEERNIVLTYKWPGFARDLIAINRTVFSMRFRTSDPDDTADVTTEIRVANDVGSTMLENMNPTVDGDEISEYSTEAYKIFTYRNHALPMHERHIRLKLFRF